MIKLLRRYPRRLLLAATLAPMFALLTLHWLLPLPLPVLTEDLSTVVVDRADRPLRAFTAPSGVWRFAVQQEQVAPGYLRALIAFEDRWFYRHVGFNPAAMLRAAAQALRHRKVVSGGSTLTMQVARLIEPHPRTLAGKSRQLFRALQLEATLSKTQILELYLNYAPFGGNVQGIEAASFAYLGKSARSLSLAEAALLVALPQAPSRLRPDRHPERARAARDKVLRRLLAFQVISASDAAAAMREQVFARALITPRWAPHLAQRLKHAHPRQTVLKTEIDLELQIAVQTRVEEYFGRLDSKVSASVMVLEHADGAVRVYVGGAKFGDPQRAGHLDLVRAERSPGSTLKPFIYGLALEQGLIHSESLLLDVPLNFADYRPQNFDRRFTGPVPASAALKRSLNLPAVQLLDRITPEHFAARLSHVGLALRLPSGGVPNLTLALGGGATTLESLIGAYSALARAGLTVQPRLLREQPVEQRRLLSAGAAYIVRDMLSERARPYLSWKTGTSFGFRDTWALGSTPEYTAGVWIGRPDGTPLPGSMGADTALPLLRQILLALPRRAARNQAPNSVQRLDICWPLGRAASATAVDLCQQRRSALILEGVAPPTLSAPGAAAGWSPQLPVRIDAASGRRLSLSCAPGTGETRQIARWPEETQAFLDPSFARAQAIPPLRADCLPDGLDELEVLRIDGVPDGAELRALPGSTRGAQLQVKVRGAQGPIRWLVNGQLEATLPAREPFVFAFSESGPASLLAVAERGRFARLTVRVR